MKTSRNAKKITTTEFSSARLMTALWIVVGIGLASTLFSHSQTPRQNLDVRPVGFTPVVQEETDPNAAQTNPLRKNSSKPNIDEFDSSIRPLLENYCLDCHTGDDAEGGVNLDRFDSISNVISGLETWGRIYEAIDSRLMPPADADQPLKQERKQLRIWIKSTIAGHAKLDPPAMRRLNRVEYENSVSDLLKFNRTGFNNPASILFWEDYFRPESGKMPKYVLAISHFSYGNRRRPALPGVSNPPIDPPVEHGFSNDHRSLSISPLLLEKYFEIANSVVNSPGFPDTTDLWDDMFVVDESISFDEKVASAGKRLGEFLPRAFRRPIEQDELEVYSRLFTKELASTGSYTEAMKSVVSAILVSPNFLFRDDFSKSISDSANHDDYSMASRLSYFLWGTMPDDELFKAAAKGSLRNPAGLKKQVRRMLADRRIKSLSVDFGMQWLKVRKINSAMPDKEKFPRYYDKHFPPPGISMMIEQLLLFETILVEDRSILDFIEADFAYLNQNLMEWYQLKPREVLGYMPRRADFEDFFRIQWPNTHRGGIVTSGAMLVSTSTTTRTSPVFRGAWILDVVFNRPPPPPPADVPALDDVNAEHTVPVNVRDKLEQHRLDPACASCHDRLDPIGFALEKFDAVGRWRKNYDDGKEIDASGALDGFEYEGAAKFKRAIVRKKSRFVRGFVEQVMEYALGRPLSVADLPDIERITQKVIRQDCRFSAVITEVVLSKPFRAYAD